MHYLILLASLARLAAHAAGWLAVHLPAGRHHRWVVEVQCITHRTAHGWRWMCEAKGGPR